MTSEIRGWRKGPRSNASEGLEEKRAKYRKELESRPKQIITDEQIKMQTERRQFGKYPWLPLCDL
jgi:hypothetical protein